MARPGPSDLHLIVQVVGSGAGSGPFRGPSPQYRRTTAPVPPHYRRGSHRKNIRAASTPAAAHARHAASSNGTLASEPPFHAVATSSARAPPGRARLTAIRPSVPVAW